MIAGLDHLVLTVADIPTSVDFYTRVLGMTETIFAGGRVALAFGSQKINLHQVGREFAPHARNPGPGTADLCFVASVSLEQVVERLRASAVEIVEGPVLRTGAVGPILSVYIRDPDENLIEISVYGAESG